MKFQSFIHPDRLPTNGIVYTRVTDDVLDPEDWGVWELTLCDNEVVGVKEVKEGAYRMPDFVGMCREDLAVWSCYDAGTDGLSIGPQTFHEISVD